MLNYLSDADIKQAQLIYQVGREEAIKILMLIETLSEILFDDNLKEQKYSNKLKALLEKLETLYNF